MTQHPAAAPHFTLRNQHGENVELAAASGAPVLLMFYPFAFSRVCGSELREVHLRWEELQQTGASVLGISCDSVHTLRAYAGQLVSSLDSAEQHAPGGQPEQLPQFDLLSDFWPHGAVAHRYGVLNQHTGGPQRVSFLLDGALRIRHRITSEDDGARSLDRTLELLRTL
ncbi:MAG: redoxin domain-containing protein [Nesterenkonia sp.]